MIAIVPHPDDIGVAKLCAGREKDVAWLRIAVQHGIVDVDAMRASLNRLPDDGTAPTRDILDGRMLLLR